jgi:predicted Zn-dependent protease
VKLKTILAAALVALASACAKPSADEHMKRADDYVAQNRLPEAVVEYRNAMQADPMRGDVRLKLGEAYLKSGEFRGALDQFVLIWLCRSKPATFCCWPDSSKTPKRARSASWRASPGTSTR